MSRRGGAVTRNFTFGKPDPFQVRRQPLAASGVTSQVSQFVDAIRQHLWGTEHGRALTRLTRRAGRGQIEPIFAARAAEVIPRPGRIKPWAGTRLAPLRCMTLASRAILWLSPLVLAAGLACNDDCDELCLNDYDDCTSKGNSDSCEAELDQCRAYCGSQTVDFFGEEN